MCRAILAPEINKSDPKCGSMNDDQKLEAAKAIFAFFHSNRTRFIHI